MSEGELFKSPRGCEFYMTVPYLRGALDAQKNKYMNPYPPGPALAQYNYGFANERQGDHDAIDLPFERIPNA